MSFWERHQSRIREEPVMEKGITFVGLDAHKVSINVALLLPGRTVAVEWECANEKASVLRMVRKVKREAPGEIRCCYEAGPCAHFTTTWAHQVARAVCE